MRGASFGASGNFCCLASSEQAGESLHSMSVNFGLYEMK